jgi:hypothetical protein
MAWGKRAADDLCDKLRSGVTSLFVLPFRSFGGCSLPLRGFGWRPQLFWQIFSGEADAVKFAGALATNTTLTEFHASGKSIGIEGARAMGTSA